MPPFKPVVNGPIAGQAWTNAPRSMPYDRPAQFADLNEALNWTFKRLTVPAITKSLLNLLDVGAPIDIMAAGIIRQGFQEGKFGAPIAPQMIGPVVCMLWRMAESANIDPQISTDKNAKVGDFDPADLAAAEARVTNTSMDKAVNANDKSQKELNSAKLVDKGGFMKFRPKTMLGMK